MANEEGYVSTDIGPFAMVPLWIVRRLAREPNGTAAVTVFAALHAWTNRDRTCYPAIDTIGEMAGVTAPTVKRALKTLERIGALAISRQPGDTGKGQSRTNLYRLIYTENDLPVTEHEGANDDTPRGVNDETPGGVDNDTPNHIHITHIQKNQMDTVIHITQEAEIVTDSDMMFDEFWRAYPRTEGKKAARRSWEKMSADEQRQAVEALVDHLQHWHGTGTERQFIPHASTWLNGRRWEDEFDSGYRPAGSLAQQVTQYSRIRRQGGTGEQRRGFDGTRALDRVNYGME